MRGWPLGGLTALARLAITRQNPTQTPAAELVRREFTATDPDEISCADVTYVPTQAGFLYLGVVIEVWSRRKVGWSMRDNLSTPLVTDAPDQDHRRGNSKHPETRIDFLTICTDK